MKTLTVALLVVALMGVASAGRVPAGDSFDAFVGALQRRRGGGGRMFEEGKAVVASVYTVPPNLHEAFIDKWRDVESEALREKRLIRFTLGKTFTDNLYFTCYGEWESMDDMVDYMNSDYVRDWKNWLEKNDIEVDMYPLKIPLEEQEMRHRSKVQASNPLERRGRKEKTAHVLIKFHVPPSVRDDFIDTWKDVAESTYDEKGNREYMLRAIATKNHHFLVCGTWDSFEDYQDHLQSKHLQRLKDFAADNEILWKLEPIKNIGELEF